VKYNIVYAGIDPKTLLLLYEETSFQVIAVSRIANLFANPTFNPVNVVFKLIYFLRRQNKLRSLELLLLRIWSVTNVFSTSVYYKYRHYLETVSRNSAVIIDFTNPSIVSEYFKANDIDLLVVNVWGILSENIIFTPKFKTVNIHPSQLPQYRGSLPTLWALKNHDTESAVTYMILDNSVDGGDIIAQHTFCITDEDNWLTLELKIDKIIKETLATDLKAYLHGIIKPYVQSDKNNSTTGKYNDYRLIQWSNETGRDIYNKINLYPFFDPHTFCYTYLNKRKLIFKKSCLLEDKTIDGSIQPGNFLVRGFYLLIQSNKKGILQVRLFLDLPFMDSLYIFFKRQGVLSDRKY
jgi:methionyl-tRNA formyltransferase